MTSPYLEFADIAKDVSASLRYLADIGCRGADCSDQSLAKVRSWDMAAARMNLMQCDRCRLAAVRKRVVRGHGNLGAAVVFVGGIPEPGDDQTGRSFSGPAGELLARIIAAMELDLESVYITHAVKCRPSDAKTDEKHIVSSGAADIEVRRACRFHLEAELSVIRPRIICALGDTAARSLSDTEASVGRIRGRFFPFKGSRVMATFSPEHILAHPSAKRTVWEDVKKIMAVLAGA